MSWYDVSGALAVLRANALCMCFVTCAFQLFFKKRSSFALRRRSFTRLYANVPPHAATPPVRTSSSMKYLPGRERNSEDESRGE